MITNIKELPNNIMGIYIIKYDNNKIYIGQAGNIKARAYEHNSKQRYPCDVALKKHNATISILEEVQDINLLEEKEIYYISQYNATNKDIGYNILDGGNASGKRGIENQNAMFSQEELDNIIDLLINHTELSLLDIAKIYNVDQVTILRISKGYSYINPELTYPLRENNHDSMRKDKVEDYFLTEETLIELKDDLYYRWDLSIETDLVKKYNIPLRVIRDINNGRKFENIGNYNYPIRQKNIRNNNNFKYEDILNILNLLKNSKKSMTDIGNLYHINRCTVAKINEGKTYIIKDYNYPARKK